MSDKILDDGDTTLTYDLTPNETMPVRCPACLSEPEIYPLHAHRWGWRCTNEACENRRWSWHEDRETAERCGPDQSMVDDKWMR